jgi:hypothetical protein
MKGHWEHKTTHNNKSESTNHNIIRIIGQDKHGHWVDADKRRYSDFDLNENYVYLDTAPPSKEGLGNDNNLIEVFKGFSEIAGTIPTPDEPEPQSFNQQSTPLPITTFERIEHYGATKTPTQEIIDRIESTSNTSKLSLYIDISFDLTKVKQAIDLLNLDKDEVIEYVTKKIINNINFQQSVEQSISTAMEYQNDVNFISDVIKTLEYDTELRQD